MDVLLEGMFYNGYGFAEDNRFLLHALDKAGCRVKIIPRDASSKHSALNEEEIRYIERFEQTVLQHNDIYICNYMGSFITRKPQFRINIARTGFETDRIPDFWLPKLNAFDEIWVFSSFNKQTFAGAGITANLKVIPSYCAWADQVLPEPPASTGGPFTFLSVFDWSDRKGYDILIKAYIEEFTSQDPVSLIIKTTDGHDAAIAAVKEWIAAIPDAPEIRIVNRIVPTDELIQLYQSSDAFVLPTRGEGWGRPVMEAMILGLPVIVTNWSGPTDFITENNAYPIQVEQLTTIHDHIYLFNGHRWAEPSLTDLRKHMRQVYSRPELAKEKGKQARKDITDRYGKDQMIGLIAKEVEKFKI
ncbi:glycosyltransferase family 4 protein [Paenibacillus protaetiae]|uniref:Glycosyltransferase n=1 Tax=Paenibacillus protaetiae TaxID=2509456 RepID=A0A4P6ETY9_9BACL|nr:glycosyltransferase family 4 protein [Paenibacillus protaetiae]QAY65543.1 glycosyltransferase [Paenibacillus protaetiae]